MSDDPEFGVIRDDDGEDRVRMTGNPEIERVSIPIPLRVQRKGCATFVQDASGNYIQQGPAHYFTRPMDPREGNDWEEIARDDVLP